jgi:DNA-directed RNA polymerase specialized sigma subunit
MTAFETVLSDVFENHAERRLTLEEERDAIRQAKGGDQDATVALVYAYAAALRSAVGRYRHAGGGNADSDRDSYAVEDLRSSAVTGLLEAVAKFDLDGEHERLAATISGYLTNEIGTGLVSPIAFSVPARTLKRFYGILREANGNVFEATKLAPERAMRRETFLAVLDAVREAEGVEALQEADAANGSGREIRMSPLWDGSEADAEDRVMVEIAFDAVNTLEGDVCRLAYGFADYDPIGDDEIGGRLFMSRQKVQRVRSGALVKMRAALGADA